MFMMSVKRPRRRVMQEIFFVTIVKDFLLFHELTDFFPKVDESTYIPFFVEQSLLSIAPSPGIRLFAFALPTIVLRYFVLTNLFFMLRIME